VFAFLFARRRRHLLLQPARRFQALRAVVRKFLLLVAAVALLHVAAMLAFEGLTLREAIWLTTTTMMTVGYGDFAAKTAPGQISTMLLLYAAGIFLAAQAASAWFDYRGARREAMRSGEWDWSGLKEHIVIVAPGRIGELFFGRLVTELDQHAETRGREVVIVSDEFRDGLPGTLAAGEVRLASGFAQDPDTLGRAGVASCAYALVLADDPEAPLSDGLSYDIVSRLREANKSCELIVQCVDDRNRSRLLAAGANVAMRPVHAYPEFIVTGLLYPGCIEVMENLFTAAGERLVLVKGSFRGTWRTLVGDMLARDAGLPIAARLAGGKVLTAPRAEQAIEAEGLYVLVSSPGAA
jgi:voltage-gated potassium channel